MKLQHRLTGQVIDVPVEHANQVLLPQGRWLEYTAKEDPEITPVEVVAPKSAPKKKRAVRRKAK